MVCDTKAERELTSSEYSKRRTQCEEGVQILGNTYPEIKSLRDATLEIIESNKSGLGPTVYNRCRFIVEENQRVLDIAEELEVGNWDKVGNLASVSFAGARDLYEIVSIEMQQMYDAIMTAPGAYGARGAGAGFGGCMVAFINNSKVEQFTHHVISAYKRDSGIDSQVYPVTASDGTGVLLFE